MEGLIILLGVALPSTALSVRHCVRVRAAQRRRLRRLEEAREAAARAAAVVRVRTELEERQVDVRARYIVTSTPPRARVLTPAQQVIAADLRRLEALDTMDYDPAVWEA